MPSESDVRTKFKRVTDVYFGWIMPALFVAGALWTLNRLDAAGEWTLTTAAAFVAGIMLIIGTQTIGYNLAGVVRRAL